jgi:glutamate-1-semialdehyde 2,1-aminomutase
LATICREKGIPFAANRVGAMMTLFFTAGPVKTYQDVCGFDRERFNRFFWGMLDQGIYLAPSQFEAGFISLAHSEADIERTLDAARIAIS